MIATRMKSGLLFECPTPSIWLLVGAPVTMAYDGEKWVVSMTGRDGVFREGRYPSRDAAIELLARCYLGMARG